MTEATGFGRLASMVCLCALLLVGGSAHATWSIAAVDRASGQVGVAGASCTYNVQGVGEVVPGKGVVVVQAMSNDDARDRGLELMRDGATPAQIVQAMRDTRFDPENQQYGVVVLASGKLPATYSGKSIDGWSGTRTGDGVSVQGNTLVDEKVVSQTFDAFHAMEGKRLVERLLKALVAGADAGGDKRCGAQHARSAFVTVFKADDDQRTPYFHLVVYGIEKGGESAVARLAQEFQRLQEQGAAPKSTRIYIIP